MLASVNAACGLATGGVVLSTENGGLTASFENCEVTGLLPESKGLVAAAVSMPSGNPSPSVSVITGLVPSGNSAALVRPSPSKSPPGFAVKSLYVTELSVLVEAAFGLPSASVALAAAMLAITVPLVVMPLTATL